MIAPVVPAGLYRCDSLLHTHSIYLDASREIVLHLKRCGANAYWSRVPPVRMSLLRLYRPVSDACARFLASIAPLDGAIIGVYSVGHVDCHNVLRVLVDTAEATFTTTTDGGEHDISPSVA